MDQEEKGDRRSVPVTMFASDLFKASELFIKNLVPRKLTIDQSSVIFYPTVVLGDEAG